MANNDDSEFGGDLLSGDRALGIQRQAFAGKQIDQRSLLPYDPKAKAAQRDSSGRYYPSLPPSDFANFAGMASESLAFTAVRPGEVARFSHSCGSTSWS